MRGLALSFLVAMSAGAAAAADPDPRVWTLSEHEGRHALGFAVPETDDVMVTFSCYAGSGSVDIFVAAATDKIKPGDTVDFMLEVGVAKSPLKGGAAVNMMDGVPSINAGAGINDKAFVALASAKPKDRFAISVAGASQTASLASLGDKGKKFAKTCKPQTP